MGWSQRSDCLVLQLSLCSSRSAHSECKKHEDKTRRKGPKALVYRLEMNAVELRITSGTADEEKSRLAYS